MPEFNTEKCPDYSSFIKDLAVINSEIKFNWSDVNVDKVDNWIRRNWAYLQKGDSEENQDLKDFEIRLQRLARHDPTAKRILETFTKCLTETSYFDLVPPDILHPTLTNTSYFEIAPADILRHTVNFLGSTGRRILYDSHISEKTDAMVENTMVMDLNKGLHVKELGLPYEKLKSFLKKHDESIKQLNLSGLSKDIAVELALLCSNLTTLNLDGCSLDLEALSKILNGENLGALQTLNLSYNELGNELARVLATSRNIKQVQYLDLSYNNIKQSEACALAKLENLQQVRHLNLSCNYIRDEGACALAASKSFPQIEHLNLYDNMFGDDGACAFAVLENFPKIQHLNFGANQIGDKGARALAELRNLQQVRHLDLSYNKIGDEGARALAASEHINQVEHLNLCWNKLSEEQQIEIKNQFEEKVMV